MKSCSRPKTVLVLVLVLLGLGLGLVYRAYRESPAGGLLEPHGEVRWKLHQEPTNHSRAQPPCGLRWVVERDVLLKKKFQFTVPVFLTPGSLSEESWSRLSLREPPYGWAGLDKHVVGESLSLLTSSELWDGPAGGALQGDRCLRCAVVGNGGILRGSGQGPAIDEHDLVFRVNGAILKGFEADVGTKTSFYGFTTNSMKNSLAMYRRDGFYSAPRGHSLKYIFIPSNLRDYAMLWSATRGRSVPLGPDRGDRPRRYFGDTAPSGFRMLHPDFIHYATHSFLESPLMLNPRTRQLYMPSTGALLLLTALHTCHQVSAFGFITENFESFSDHYYDSVHKPLRFYSNHDLRMEQRLWESLHQRGVISLYHREV